MVGVEPEPAIFCNQAKPQMEGLGFTPTTKPLTYNVCCLQSVLELEPTIIVTRETIQQLMGTDAETYSQTIRGSFGSPVKEGEEGSEEPEGSGQCKNIQPTIPQSQLTGTHGGSQGSGSL